MCKWFLKAISRHLFMTPPSRGDSALAFAREMGHRYHTNGDGWGSMCAAADKLSLINGFSPGHLISLALSLKSNLTLCMSVNINKPSNPALKCHLLCRTWCQAREPIWWRGLLLCVFEMESEGTEKKSPALFSDIHQHRAGTVWLCFQSPLKYCYCQDLYWTLAAPFTAIFYSRGFS